MKPLTPQEVSGIISTREFPDFIIQAFNECIVTSKTRHSGVVYQEDVLVLAVALSKGQYTRQQIFDNHWLDVEDHYRAAGWKVEYYKPSYFEEERAHYTFTTGV